MDESILETEASFTVHWARNTLHRYSAMSLRESFTKWLSEC